MESRPVHFCVSPEHSVDVYAQMCMVLQMCVMDAVHL